MPSPHPSALPTPATTSADTSVPAVSVKALTKAFRSAGGKQVQVLQGVDLVARAGEVTTLLGTNGAGKSTTLACAQGLLEPDGGEVRLLGQTPWHADANLRARVGVMFQDGGLPPSQKPVSYLRHVASLYRHPRHVGELVHLLGIDQFAKTSIRRLSGGQKQRLALAVALIGDPEVLFLDEPSAGLDPQSRQVVFDLIRTLRAEGRAVVLTTHLLEDAEKLSDTIYVIDRGRTVAHGSVAELTQADGAADLVAGFAAGVTPAWPEGVWARREGADTWVVQDVADPELLARLTRAWADQGLMPQRLHLRQRTLEEAFLELADHTDGAHHQEEATETA
ncbi:MAG: ABC transporter ATP-binding protein [Galactobacter sp.]